ncbi:hypothetical protein K7432_015541 [Basidiobolus ranarum]|uniref:Phosphoglycerate mutase-like protein n=1 Tax=Basidiobolus ranarum TaxID=34480 RepID=A0ABR2WG00_9FUNG
MTQNSIPNLVCYFARHGERIDHIDSTWTDTTSTPYDPPLSKEGFLQAKATGVHLADVEHRFTEKTACENISTEVHFITSPFIRCVQTALCIASGLTQQNRKLHSNEKASRLPPVKYTLNIEPGVGEWMSSDYAFIEQATSEIATTRKTELRKGFQEVVEKEELGELPLKVNWEYEPARTELASFPETFGEMCRRIQGTFEKIVSRVVSNTNSTAFPSVNNSSTRTILIFVTHGAVIKPLLFYTIHKYALPNIHYCCLSRVHVDEIVDSEDTENQANTLSWKADLIVTTSHL